MICDSLVRFGDYIAVHPLFRTVFEYISNNDIFSLEKGRINLPGRIYAIVDEYETCALEDTFIECHRTYIDIQIILHGKEQIGFCNRDACRVGEDYSKEKDCEKLKGKVDLLTLRKGYFMIFYPQDGHVPGLMVNHKRGRVKKIVFKVPV